MSLSEKSIDNIINKISTKTNLTITKAQISRDLNISRQYLTQLKNENLPDKYIKKLEEIYAVSLFTDLSSKTLQLDYYPNVFGSCGNGSMVFDETSEKISVTKDQISNYMQSGKYSVISARGSSMSPVIMDEDLLIIQHNLNENIIDNTIYLFKYNDELFIKRLVKNIDQIICISENPRFEDRVIIPKNNFEIVGKVVGLIRKKV